MVYYHFAHACARRPVILLICAFCPRHTKCVEFFLMYRLILYVWDHLCYDCAFFFYESAKNPDFFVDVGSTCKSTSLAIVTCNSQHQLPPLYCHVFCPAHWQFLQTGVLLADVHRYFFVYLRLKGEILGCLSWVKVIYHQPELGISFVILTCQQVIKKHFVDDIPIGP